MKRGRLRRAALALLGLGVGLGVVGVGGLALLCTGPGNELVRRGILAFSEDIVPRGGLRIGRLDFNLVSRVELDDVALLDSSGHEILSFDRLLVRYDLRGVFYRRVALREVRLEKPRVDLQTLDNGNLDLLDALGVDPSPPSTTPSQPWGGLAGQVDLGGLQIQDADIRYRAGDLDLHLSDLDLDAHGTVYGPIARLDQISLRGDLIRGATLPLSLDGQIGLQSGDLLLGGVRLGLGDTWLGLDGQIASVETSPDLDLRGDLGLSPGDLAALLQTEDPPVTSPATLALVASGPLSDLTATGDLSGPAGDAHLEAWANLDASPAMWRISLDTDRLALDELLAAVTERTVLSGHTAVEGAGTAWPELPGQDDPDLIRAKISLDGGDQTLWGERVRDLRVEADVDAGRVKLSRLSARHALGSLSATGEVDVPAGRADLRATASVSDLSQLGRYGVDGMGGSARYSGRIRADWSGEALALEASGELSGQGLSAPGDVALDGLSGTVNARVDGDRVEASGQLDASGLRAPGASVGDAALGFSVTRAASGALNADLSDLAVADVHVESGPVSLARLSGSLSVGLSARGDPSGQWELQVEGLTLPTGVSGDGPIRGAIRQDRLELSTDLRHGDSPVLVSQTSGDLKSGVWTISDLALAPTPDSLWQDEDPVRFTLAPGGATDVHLALSSPQGSLGLDGRLIPDDLDATLAVGDLSLPWVAALTGTLVADDPLRGLAGNLSLDAHLSAAGAAPPALTAKLDGRELMLPGTLEAPVHLSVEATLADQSLRLNSELSDSQSGLLAIGGDIPVDIDINKSQAALRCEAPLTLRALAGPLVGADLSRLVPGAGDAFERASVDLRLSGAACDPEIQVRARGQVRDADTGKLLDARVDLSREDGKLTLGGGLDADLERRADLDGTADTRLGRVLAWALRGGEEPDLSAPSTWVSDMDTSVALLGVPLSLVGAPPDVRGELLGGVNLRGGLDHLELSGGLQWMDASLGDIALNLGYLGLTPAEGGYDLDLRLGFAQGGKMAVSGFLPMSLDLSDDAAAAIAKSLDDPRLALRISDGEAPKDGVYGHATVPLAVLSTSESGISSASGDLELWGDLTGSISHPIPALQARLYDGALTVDSTEVRYEAMNLDAELSERRLLLRDLSMLSRPRYGAALKKGKLSATGSIGLSDFNLAGIALDASLDDFALGASDDLTLSTSGNVRARGAWPGLTISGGLTLGNTRIFRTRDDFLSSASLSLSPDIAVFRGGEQVRARSLGERPSVIDRFKLDMSVKLDRKLHLKVELPIQADYGEQFAALSSIKLDADFDGDLTVGGSIGQPNLLGGIETTAGTVEVMGATFNLSNDGTINFVGEDYANPILNLSASRHTSGYGDVSVKITQDVNHVKVDFSADDYSDPSDALSLVVFGKPASELTDVESGHLGNSLMALARSGLSGQLERAVGLSAIDQFEIDPSSGAVKVGKAISDHLFLSIEQRLSTDETHENLTEATVEWLILSQLYADFVTGDAGQSSADIYWRWRF